MLIDALFERLIPGGEILGLGLHLIVQFLDPQHRADTRDQRRLVDRLSEIFVGAGIEPGDHVLRRRPRGAQDDRHERHGRIFFQPPAHFEAVELRHFDIKQHQIGTMLARTRQCLFAVGRLQRLIAVLCQPGDEDIPVGLVVVDDEDARWTVHGTLETPVKAKRF